MVSASRPRSTYRLSPSKMVRFFNFTLRFGKVGLCIHVPLRISACSVVAGYGRDLTANLRVMGFIVKPENTWALSKTQTPPCWRGFLTSPIFRWCPFNYRLYYNFTLRFGKVGLCIHVLLRISATYDVVICLEARLQNAPLEGVTFIGVL